MSSPFDARPIVVAVAGPNGAGKTTFFHAHLSRAALRYVNADDLGQELQLSPYDAAAVAQRLRLELVRNQESFVFETVFSDAEGEKVRFLEDTVRAGYAVVLCFIGIRDAALSDERVAMRVLQGGHDVPEAKIRARFPRTLANLRRAVERLPHVLIYDNSDLAHPYRKVLEIAHGQRIGAGPVPAWLAPALDPA